MYFYHTEPNRVKSDPILKKDKSNAPRLPGARTTKSPASLETDPGLLWLQPGKSAEAVIQAELDGVIFAVEIARRLSRWVERINHINRLGAVVGVGVLDLRRPAIP